MTDEDRFYVRNPLLPTRNPIPANDSLSNAALGEAEEEGSRGGRRGRNRANNRQLPSDVVTFQYESGSEILKQDPKYEPEETLDDIHTSCSELEEEEEREEEVTRFMGIGKRKHNDDDEDEEGVGEFLNSDEDEKDTPLKRPRKQYKSCFLCATGNHDHAAIDGKNMNKCLSIIRDNLGLDNVVEVSRQAHVYYKEEIYEHANKDCDSTKRVPMMRTKDFVRHIREHTLEPTFWIAEEMKDLRETKLLTKKCRARREILVDGSSRVVPDKDMIKMGLEVTKRMMELYRFKPQGLNFYCEKVGVDLTRMGNIINPNKNFIVERI